MSFLRFVNIDTNFTDEPMDGVGVCTQGGKLHCIGGWNGNNNPADRNTHYTWDGATKVKLANAPFLPSHGHGIQVKNDTIYKVGADAQPDSTSNDRSQVWKYTTANGWQLVNSFAELSDLVVFDYIIHNGVHYIIGGHRVLGTPGNWSIDKDHLSNYVYKSEDDFATLQTVTSSAPVGGNAYGCYQSYNGRVFGSCVQSVYDNTQSNRVYSVKCHVTDDFLTFTDLPNFPGRRRQYLNTRVWDNKLWLINGGTETDDHTAAYNLQEAWYYNGYNWAWIPYLPLTATHATGVTVLNDALHICCGNLNSQLYKLERYT